MIGEDDTARLADFGIIGVILDPADESATLKLYNSNRVRYMAPELLSPPQFRLPNSNPTKESDVYSFAMTTYQACSSLIVHNHRPSLTPNPLGSRRNPAI